MHAVRSLHEACPGQELSKQIQRASCQCAKQHITKGTDLSAYFTQSSPATLTWPFRCWFCQLCIQAAVIDRGLWAVGLHHNMSLKAQQVNTSGSGPILPALNGDDVCQAAAQQGGCSSMLSGLLLRPGISATFSSKLRAAPPGNRKHSAPTLPAPARPPRPEGGCRRTAASHAAHARAPPLSSPVSAAAARPCSARGDVSGSGTCASALHVTMELSVPLS